MANIEADATKGVKVDAGEIAQSFREGIQERVKALLAKGEGTKP